MFDSFKNTIFFPNVLILKINNLAYLLIRLVIPSFMGKFSDYTCKSRPTLHFEKSVMPADGWLVRCPSCDPSKCFVLGGRNRNNQLMYSEYTQICCSSQHAGIIVSIL